MKFRGSNHRLKRPICWSGQVKDACGEHPPLNRAEQAEVSARAKAGDISARNTLVESCLGMALGISKGDEDIFQDCAVAMLRGADTFDPAKGAITTHLSWWMFNGLKRSLQSNSLVHVPVHAHKLRHAVHRGKPIDDRDAPFLASAQRAYDSRPASLWSDDAAEVSHRPDPAPCDPSRAMCRAEALETIEAAIDSLPERQRTIVRLYFGIGCPRQSLEQIGEQLGGVRREAIRQVKNKAIDRLRDVLLDSGNPQDLLESLAC